MTTISTTELLEKIKIIEQEKAKFGDKLLRISSTIKTTEEIASAKKKKRVSISNPLLIKRNLKLDFILYVIVWIAISTPLLYSILSNYLENVIGEVFGVALVLLMFFAFFINLTAKRLTLPIILSDSQIEIIGETYQWATIENTFFVIKANSSSSFIIGFKDGSLKYFIIGNQLGFKYNESDFSEFVEHFRNMDQKKDV